MGGDARVGSIIAGYRVESRIAQGGMSVVYLAQDLRLDRKVALKVLDEALAGDPRFRERFVRESQLAAGMEHPNIVPIYEAGEADGVLYIAMRYISGADLGTLIAREGRLDPVRAVSILSQVGGALDEAHERGLIHRDVKPANVLLDRRQSVEHAYLSDFGITKHLGSTTGLTGTGQFVGTVDYIAPEQVEGKAVDGRADIYSLGCVFFECVTGEVPFRKDDEVGVIFAQLGEVPPSARVRRPELPAALDTVIARAMAKDREQRFPTAGAMMDAARTALAGWRAGAPIPEEATVVSSGFSPPSAAATSVAVGRIPAPVMPSYQQPAPPSYQQPAPPSHQQPAPGAYQQQPPAYGSGYPPSAVAHPPGVPWTPFPAPTPPSSPWRRYRIPLAVGGGLIVVLAVVLVVALSGSKGSTPGRGTPSGPATGETLGAPATFTVSAQNGGEVTLAWAAPAGSGKVDGYVIYRNGQQLERVTGTTLTYRDLGVSPSSTYTYAVRAVSGQRTGATSREVTLTTPPPPPPGEARLEGTFAITRTTVSSSFKNETPGQQYHNSWTFTATCQSGPCDVKIDVGFDRTPAQLLALSNGVYTGILQSSAFTCQSKPIAGSITITLRVVRAQFSDGAWLATRVSGTEAESAPASTSCTQSGGQYKVVGTS